MDETVRISVSDAYEMAFQALKTTGVSVGAARSTARALVGAERDGQKGHGLVRVASYCAQVRAGKINSKTEPRLRRISDAAALVDADFGFAYPAIDLAIEELIRLTRLSKFAAVGVQHSHHFGQAGAHVEQLAQAGLIAMLFGNSPKAIAFWGGATPMMGTNPIAFAAPLRAQKPLVIDLALSVVARGKIVAAAKAGEAIPIDWALDREGVPTTDAHAALAGSMLPLGGAKGAALALMVEVLAAALTNSKFGFEATSFLNSDGPPPDVGCLFVALDPAAFSSGAYFQRMETLMCAMAEEQEVRMPGSRRFSARAAADKYGLEISEDLQAELVALAQG